MAADQADYAELRTRPDVFMRGALEHTCAFVGEHDVYTAKRLAHILSGAPLARPPVNGPDNHHRDYFVIDLDLDAVQRVLLALGEQRTKIEQSQRGPHDGSCVLLQALAEDWLALATFLLRQIAAAGLGLGNEPEPAATRAKPSTPDYDLN